MYILLIVIMLLIALYAIFNIHKFLSKARIPVKIIFIVSLSMNLLAATTIGLYSGKKAAIVNYCDKSSISEHLINMRGNDLVEKVHSSKILNLCAKNVEWMNYVIHSDHGFHWHRSILLSYLWLIREDYQWLPEYSSSDISQMIDNGKLWREIDSWGNQLQND